MDLSSCDYGASAPSTDVLCTARPDPEVASETAEGGLNVSWTGLFPWIGVGLSPTSLVQESDR